jgi:hypothetical protein
LPLLALTHAFATEGPFATGSTVFFIKLEQNAANAV